MKYTLKPLCPTCGKATRGFDWPHKLLSKYSKCRLRSELLEEHRKSDAKVPTKRVAGS